MSSLRNEEQEDGEPRFSMLETIHEFALEQLGESEQASAVRSATLLSLYKWRNASSLR